MTSTDDIAQAFAEIPYVAVELGTFVRQDGVHALVDVGTSRLPVPSLGTYFPVPGDSVRLLRVGKSYFMLGPAAPKSSVGRVSATGSPRCTVEYPAGSGVTQQMGYPTNITPAVNQLVLIDWASGGTIIDTITALPIWTIPDDPSTGGGGGTHTETFQAADSGTWYSPASNWSTTDVWVGTGGVNTGCWFYGTKIRDTIPDTATINAVEVYLPLYFTGSGGNPTARLHTHNDKPGGAPSLTGSSAALAGRDGWVSIPTAFLDHMKVNGGGLALTTGAYLKYRGVPSDAMSGALRVTYTT